MTLGGPLTGSGMKFGDCMTWCSTFDELPLCYGVAYFSTPGKCEFFGKSVDFSLEESAATNAVAVVQRSQLQPLDTTCPYPTNSDQTVGGEDFIVFCNMDLPGIGDYQPVSYGYPGVAPWHADTMEECMVMCVHAHPLCVAVSWNPDMHGGFQNCYPKNDISQKGDSLIPNNGSRVVHSAKVVTTFLSTIDTSCTEGNQTEGGKTFDVSCREQRTDFSNITAIHANKAEVCMEACATKEKDGCLGIYFDMSLSDGYDNCFLLNSTGKYVGGGNATYASLVGPVSKRSSKAWIAGPVVGGVIALLLLTIVVWWWRRRKTRWPNEIRDAGRQPEVDGQYLNADAKEAELSEETKYELFGKSRTAELSGYSSQAELSDDTSHHPVRHELG